MCFFLVSWFFGLPVISLILTLFICGGVVSLARSHPCERALLIRLIVSCFSPKRNCVSKGRYNINCFFFFVFLFRYRYDTFIVFCCSFVFCLS